MPDSIDNPPTVATEEWPVDGPVCVVCLGRGAVPVPAYAVAPGGPDTYPCPFCQSEVINVE